MGRKKTGDLQKPLAVRLDRNVDEVVRAIALKSGVENEPGGVIRVLVSAYVMQQMDPINAFDELARDVNRWRKSYGGGYGSEGDERGGRDAGPVGKKPRRKKEP